MAVRPPVGVGETGLGAVEQRWGPPPAAGWHGAWVCRVHAKGSEQTN